MRSFLLLIFMLFIAASLGVAIAAQRQSPAYRIIIDSISSSGGKLASPTYRQSDCAIGQETACGFSAATAIQTNAGVVQAWQSLKTDASEWMIYE